jgi:dTDP-4-amino-4,6-dideoxy-D-glucose acyltransferase
LSFYSEIELREIGFKSIGENVLISKKTSIYAPETISIGDNVRIDDFCVLSGGGKGIKIGSYVHIAVFCSIFGRGGVTLEDFTTTSSRCAIYSISDDTSGLSMTNPTVPDKYLNVHEAEVIIKKHGGLGTNCTVLPGVIIGEGAAVGAHTLVIKDLEPWGVYCGSPAKKIKMRDKNVLELEKGFLKSKL